jgi:hypothetical protein
MSYTLRCLRPFIQKKEEEEEERTSTVKVEKVYWPTFLKKKKLRK